MRVRGNAYQVHEKYQALAKDAQSSGDRVLAENYLQHAEHYFRIIQAINEATLAEQRQRQATYEQPAMQGGQQPPQGGPPVPQGGGNGYYNSVNDLTGSSQPQNQQSFSGGGNGGNVRAPITQTGEGYNNPLSGEDDEGGDEAGPHQHSAIAGGRR